MKKNITEQQDRFLELITEQGFNGYDCIDGVCTGVSPPNWGAWPTLGMCQANCQLLTCWTDCNQPGDPPQSIQVDVVISSAAPSPRRKVTIFRCVDGRGCKPEEYPSLHIANDILSTEPDTFKTLRDCKTKCEEEDIKTDIDYEEEDVIVKTLREGFYSEYNRLFLNEGGGSSSPRPCGTPVPNASSPCEQCGFWDTQQVCTNLSCWSDCPNPFPISICATNQNQTCESFTGTYPGPCTGPACYHSNCDPPYFSSEPTCSNSQSQVICWTHCPNYPQTDPATSQNFPQGTTCGVGAASGHPRWNEPDCGMMWYMVRCWTDCPSGGGPATSALFGQTTGNPAQCGDPAWGSQNYPNTQQPTGC